MDGDLIKCVKKNTCLYDKNSVGFRNKIAKENAWKSISDILGDTADECEARWTNLRARYATEKRLERRGNLPGTTDSRRLRWRWMSRMAFLGPHVRARRTSGNVRIIVSTIQPDQKVLSLETVSLPQEHDSEMNPLIEDNSKSSLKLEVTSPTENQPELHGTESPRLRVREFARLDEPGPSGVIPPANVVSLEEANIKVLYPETASLPQEDDSEMDPLFEDNSKSPPPKLVATSPTEEQSELHGTDSSRLRVREFARLEEPGPSGVIPPANVVSSETTSRMENTEAPHHQEMQSSAAEMCNTVLDTSKVVTSHFKKKKSIPESDDPDLVFGKCVGMLLNDLSPTTKRRKMKQIMEVVFGD